MSHEATQAVAAAFHMMRSRRKRSGGSDRIMRAFIYRARYDEAERRFYDKLAAWDWERQWG